MNREELEKNNYLVFIQKEGDVKPRRVRFPEYVNVDTGEVKMWVPTIPGVNLEEVTADQVTSGTVTPPPELENTARLKADKGKVFIMDAAGMIVEQTRD